MIGEERLESGSLRRELDSVKVRYRNTIST